MSDVVPASSDIGSVGGVSGIGDTNASSSEAIKEYKTGFASPREASAVYTWEEDNVLAITALALPLSVLH